MCSRLRGSVRSQPARLLRVLPSKSAPIASTGCATSSKLRRQRLRRHRCATRSNSGARGPLFDLSVIAEGRLRPAATAHHRLPRHGRGQQIVRRRELRWLTLRSAGRRFGGTRARVWMGPRHMPGAVVSSPNEDSACGARPVSFPSASTAGRSADRTTAGTKRTNPTTTPHREAARVLEPRGAPAAAVTEHVLRAGHRDAVPLVRQLAATAVADTPGLAAERRRRHPRRGALCGRWRCLGRGVGAGRSGTACRRAGRQPARQPGPASRP